MDRLPVLQPDPERTARTLARCQQALARRRVEMTRPRESAGAAWERAVLTGLCVVYLISIVGNVLRMVYLG